MISLFVDLDIFIVDKPPRYDVVTDPSGMKQKLSRYANGVLASLTGATPKIFLVEQASLSRTNERARADLFQKDGLHLTKKGVNYYNNNIMNVMKECYPDVGTLQAQSKSKNSEKQSQSFSGQNSNEHQVTGTRFRNNNTRGGFDRGPKPRENNGDQGWVRNNRWRRDIEEIDTTGN